MDLRRYLDIERLKMDQSPYLVSLGTIGPDGSWPSNEGGTYGAFVNLTIKSLIWYPVPEFRAAGYAVPQTWSELLALGDRLVADGRTPWCTGFFQNQYSGWPGTDWIENLLLAGAGPRVYDQWTFHQIPFDSPPVRKAFGRLAKILFTKRYVYGGTKGIRETAVGDAQLPMVLRDPPGCWLFQFPGFAGQFLPDQSVGTKTDVFPFPALTERSGGGLLGGGNMVAAFADRPEVREVVRFLLSPGYLAVRAGRGHGLLSPNRRFDLNNYPTFWRRQAEVLNAALADDTFRFDGSDLMPPEVGLQPFWDAMMTFVSEGPKSLDSILADLDAEWPDDG
jgi:alpha-glucoside transport system substrate-binding protein